jgi:hypothetical protein
MTKKGSKLKNNGVKNPRGMMVKLSHLAEAEQSRGKVKKKGGKRRKGERRYRVNQVDSLPMKDMFVVSKLDYVLEKETDGEYIFKRTSHKAQKKLEGKEAFRKKWKGD